MLERAVVFAGDEQTHDHSVIVRFHPEATFADLLAAEHATAEQFGAQQPGAEQFGAGHLPLKQSPNQTIVPHLHVHVNGLCITPTTPLAQLRRGDLLRIHNVTPSTCSRDAPVKEVDDPRWILSTVSGPDCGRTWHLPARGRFTIGRSAISDVVLRDPSVSRVHGALLASPTRMGIDTLSNENPIVSDDRQGINRRLVLRKGELTLGLTTLTIAPVEQRPDTVSHASADGPINRDGTRVFHRPPRQITHRKPAQLVVPHPRHEQRGTKFRPGSIIMPTVFGIVMAVFVNPRMALFAAMTPLMLITNMIDDRIRRRKEKRTGVSDYATELASFRVALTKTYNDQRSSLHAMTPRIAELARRGADPSVHLWERRPEHLDAWLVTVGFGEVAIPIVFTEADTNRAFECQSAIDAYRTMHGVPVTVRMAPGETITIVGDAQAARRLANSMVTQLAALHGPADIRIGAIVGETELANWTWLAWLPHAQAPEVATGILLSTMATHEDMLCSIDETSFLVVLDLDHPTASMVLRSIARPSLCILTIVERADQLPTTTTTAITLRSDGTAGVQTVGVASTRRTHRSDESVAFDSVPFDSIPFDSVPFDMVLCAMHTDIAFNTARVLARWRDAERSAAASEIPTRVTFANAEPRWKGASPKHDHLVATLGSDEHGPFSIDFVTDGPHALIAGTTGSGKSELLRTLVVSLAETYDPSQVNFVLIDYKGGSAFARCAELPHTVGLVTDLDPGLAERALRCLEAELRHREHRFREVEATDLISYADIASATLVDRPLPRLVVIIDEFATMAKDLPDFMQALVGIAQRGRSLGVHLVLATQRPSGAVNDNIRANTNLRIALRVQDAADSHDILGNAHAASIPRHLPGRAIARLGPDEYRTFQAAICSSPSEPASETGKHSVQVTPFLPAALLSASASITSTTAANNGATQSSPLDRAVDATRLEHDRQALPRPRRPWPDPLPLQLPWTIEKSPADARSSTESGSARMTVAIGTADDPNNQSQPTAWVDVRLGNVAMLGTLASRVTECARSLFARLVAVNEPEILHIYVVTSQPNDYAEMRLWPHVGAVIALDELRRLDRLLSLLVRELDLRRTAIAHTTSAKIVVLIDNYAALKAGRDDPGGGTFLDRLHRLMNEGPVFGVTFVLVADRSSVIPTSVAASIAKRHVFALHDSFEYSQAGLKARDVGVLPPGRSIDTETGLHVQWAIAEKVDLEAACPLQTSRRSPERLPKPIDTLPERVERTAWLLRVTGFQIGSGTGHDADELSLPFGLGDDDLDTVSLQLGEAEHCLITGPGRSGKSSLLSTLAIQASGEKAIEPEIHCIALRRSPFNDWLNTNTNTNTSTSRSRSRSTGSKATANCVHRYETLADLTAGILASRQARTSVCRPQMKGRTPVIAHRSLVLIDDADMLDDPGSTMGQMLLQRTSGFWVIATARADAIRANYSHWTTAIRRSRRGIALHPHIELDGDLWTTPLPRRPKHHFTPGRGFLVGGGTAQLIQVVEPE